MLANIALYWFTGAIGSSFWPYYARLHGPWPIPDGSSVDAPMGYCEFPREILRPPRSLAARTFSDIRRWSVMAKGGHFAAMEQPEALAAEIRAFFDRCAGDHRGRSVLPVPGTNREEGYARRRQVPYHRHCHRRA